MSSPLAPAAAESSPARATSGHSLSPGLKRLRLARAYLQGRPIWCSWQVTRRCASYCLFCEHRSESGETEATLSECRTIVSEMSRLGSLLVSLTGGDPFLRSDLPEIVGLLARDHFPLLTTHGWQVTRARARAVWEAGLMAASVTLDSADAAQHDAAAGLPGAHARAVAALDAFARERTHPAHQQVNVKARLKPDAVKELEGLLALAKEHGATVTVEPSFPLTAAPRSSDLRLGARLVALRKRHPHFRSSGRYLELIDQALGEGVPGCQAGRRFLNVDHRGRVSKCLEFQGAEDRVGDLTREAMTALVPRLRTVQEANTCRACWYGSRGEVEGLYTFKGFLSALPTLARP